MWKANGKTTTLLLFLDSLFQKQRQMPNAIRSIWKVLKCGAGEEWRRSVGPIV
jgi:hypothetical protein